jgi:predicted DNA-binding transcriptional regulator AlpA
MASKYCVSPALTRFLTISQLCEMLQCTRRCIERRMRTDPEFPKPLRMSKRMLRFRLTEIEAYMDQCQKRSA